MNATHSARRSQVLSRRHQFSIREPCSRAIIAARVRLQRVLCSARGGSDAKRWWVPRRRPWRLPRESISRLGGSSICVRGLAVKTTLRASVLLPLASTRLARGPYELTKGLTTSIERTRHHFDAGFGIGKAAASPGRPLCRIARAAPGGDAGATRRVRPSGAPPAGRELLLRRAELRH